jgi:GTP-binding protein LepA
MRYVNQGKNYDVEEIGIRKPEMTPVKELGPGEVGYLIAGIKDVGEARSGETVTLASDPAMR